MENIASNQEQPSNECGQGSGYLPACAPLANPYVPYQQSNPARYEAPRGIIRGTLFPGLDLPFMGRVNTKELSQTPLHELQALSFAINELVLYLDTHSEDKEAAQLLQSYSSLYHEGLAAYTKQYGPLFSMNGASGDSYQWLQNPWPWEYMEAKEG